MRCASRSRSRGALPRAPSQPRAPLPLTRCTAPAQNTQQSWLTLSLRITVRRPLTSPSCSCAATSASTLFRPR